MSDTNKSPTKARDISPTGVRLPPDLRERLSEVAEANNRSLSAEIVARLERSFEYDTTWKNTLDSIDELWSRVDRIERMVEDHDDRLNPGKYDRG